MDTCMTPTTDGNKIVHGFLAAKARIRAMMHVKVAVFTASLTTMIIKLKTLSTLTLPNLTVTDVVNVVRINRHNAIV